MNNYVIGLDNGGTVIKAALFNMQGVEIAVASRQTPVITRRPGYIERDMEQLWELNCECIREVLIKSNIPARQVIGLAVCGHGKGLYAWGQDNRPAYPGISSTDNRAWSYPIKWNNEGTSDDLYPQLYQQLIPGQQVSLLAWLKDHERDVYDNIKWVFSVKDYIRFRLTGEAWSEITDSSGSGLMDISNSRYDLAMLARLGIPEILECLPPLRNSSDLCGTVTREAAKATGLLEGTPVAGGMFDIHACAIAMNITSSDHICVVTGTWSINEFISEHPIPDIAMNSIYPIPGYYLHEECSPTGAGNMEWLIQQLMKSLQFEFKETKYDQINEWVQSINPQDCNLYYLPFLYGSNQHPLAKGSFVGLTSYHSHPHMFRALYEGVAFSHRMHVDRLLSARDKPKAIRLAGGAAKSPVWIQMFSDVLQLPIETVQGSEELGALGGAIAAAIATGYYSNYKEAASSMVKIESSAQPNWEAASIYESKYETYLEINKALNSIWHRFEI